VWFVLIGCNCTGGGVELPAHYPQWKVEHAKFEAPAVIQASFMKLLEGEHFFCYASEP